VHVGVEIWVDGHALHFSSNSLHVLQEGVEVSNELLFGGSEAHAVFGGVVETNSGEDRVLL